MVAGMAHPPVDPVDDVRDLADRAALHGALADPARLRIVDELTLSDRSPAELGELLGIRSNLVAHHLAALEAAGLVGRVVSAGDRRRRYVQLRAERLARLVTLPALHASRVVFVCTRNSARSQLAAGLWNRGGTVPASSAGTEPAAAVHPGAVRAASELGVDLSGARPTALDDEGADRPLDDALVVTVCDLAHESLVDLRDRVSQPVLHWSVPDPATSGEPDDFTAAAALLAERVAVLRPLVHAP